MKIIIAAWRAMLWLFGLRVGREPKLEQDRKVAVIVPAYNEADILPTTLQAILAQNVPLSQLVVIDDGSTDQTSQVAKDLGCQVVRFEGRSGSKAKAVNKALAQLELSADYIAVIDADTILAEGALEKVLEHFENERVAAVCGYVLSGQTQTIWQKARAVEYIIGGGLDKGAQEWWGVPLIMAGCFTVWKANLLLEYGFPERTFTEDLDLTWQLIGQGYRVVYASEARCWTIDPQKWRDFRSQLLRWRRGFIQNLSLHFKSWIKKPRLAFFIFWWLIGGGIGMTAYYGLVAWLLFNQEWPWLGITVGSELAYLTLAALIQGGRLNYPLRIAVWAVYYCLLIKPLSLYLFWEALVRELGESHGKGSLVWKKTREKGVIQMYQPPLPISGLILRLPILAILTIGLLAIPGEVARKWGARLIGDLPEASLTLTFDDGWKSVYEKAFPILKECGAVGTVFVVTSKVNLPGFMSWEQLTELAKNNWEIASHTVSHKDLTELPEEDLIRELEESKRALEQQGFRVFSFASPYGIYDQKTLAKIREIYQAHRTTAPGINYRPIDPYLIKSFDANRDGLEDLNKAFELIREAKDKKGHLVLTFHKIDQANEELNYPGWKLEAICQYARSQGFELFRLERRAR